MDTAIRKGLQSRYIQNDCIHLRHTPKDQPAYNDRSIVFCGQVELGGDHTACLVSGKGLEYV